MTAFPVRLTDAEWAVLEPLIPANRPGGRPPKHTRRSILDAIVYVVRQGVTWRALPEGFPHWNTAFWYFQEWQKDGTWGKVEDALRKKVRLAEGRESACAVMQQTSLGEQPTPTTSTCGWQSVSTVNGSPKLSPMVVIASPGMEAMNSIIRLARRDRLISTMRHSSIFTNTSPCQARHATFSKPTWAS